MKQRPNPDFTKMKDIQTLCILITVKRMEEEFINMPSGKRDREKKKGEANQINK